jgi:hypothetical protein
MNKKYSIEVPAYSAPIDHLIKINRLKEIEIVLYGGVPNSPLNGGRFNYNLDGVLIWNRFLFSLTEKQFKKTLAFLYETITKANQGNISFRIAFTNMFVSDKELNSENLYPVKFLVESSQKYGVKNGLILNNKRLEDFIRQKYGDKLAYVSSCTKYVSPQKILRPDETLPMYTDDSAKYDYVCLTPQDSRRANLIKDVLGASKGNIIAIANSYCSDQCNSFHHYVYMSQENKKTLLAFRNTGILARTIGFIIPRATTCSAFRQPFSRMDVKKIAGMQLNAGIVNFKLGRGFGANLIDELVSLILESEKKLYEN